MTRKLSTDQEGAARVLSLRLPPALADALDAEARRRAAAAGVPVSPAAVARVLLERALLGAPTTGTARTTTSSTPDAGAQEAAQSTTTSSTPARPRRRREAAAAPPAASPKADDDEAHDERQLPLLGEGIAANAHDERNAAQAAVLLDAGHIARHDQRNAEHTAANALRAEIAALDMSGRGLAEAMTAAGFPLSGRAVSQFVNGHTAGLPRWHDKFRAWRASVAQEGHA